MEAATLSQAGASSGFPAIEDAKARVLILGSLPGQASLARGQYYAQPRNAFWPIVRAITGTRDDVPYDTLCRVVVGRHIAIWDVCASAARPGSLDASITIASVVPNDFEAFLRTHPRLERICFNGRTAAALFERLVLPQLAPTTQAIPQLTLPSTSPAHASMPYAEKLRIWRDALALVEPQA